MHVYLFISHFSKIWSSRS